MNKGIDRRIMSFILGLVLLLLGCEGISTLSESVPTRSNLGESEPTPGLENNHSQRVLNPSDLLVEELRSKDEENPSISADPCTPQHSSTHVVTGNPMACGPACGGVSTPIVGHDYI